MKTTLFTTLILLCLASTLKLNAQDPCPASNKMKDGSCIMINYPSAAAATKAVTSPAEILVVSESTDEVSNGVYIAQFACGGTEVIYTKAAPCSCSGYEGVVIGTFEFVNGDMTCQYDAAGVLPVDFSFFKAEIANDMSLLKWGTSSETDNEGFYVEKSTDGKFFQEFAFIVGEGNSSSEIEYETLDRDPFDGVNYYRLMQIDYNGNERFSNVIKLDFRNGEGVSVRFDSNTEELTVKAQKTLQSIEIFDMAGVRVHKEMLDINSTEHNIRFSTQNSGHFVAVITDQNGAVQSSKFVKM